MRAPPPAVPPARGAGRAPCARPLPLPPPPPRGLPHLSAQTLCAGRARDNRPRVFYFRGAAASRRPAGRAKITFQVQTSFFHWRRYQYHNHAHRHARGPPPLGAPPPQMPAFRAGARGARRRAPPPLGAGAPFIPSPCSQDCARLLLPLGGGVCPRPAVCPRRLGRAVGVGVCRPRRAFFIARKAGVLRVVFAWCSRGVRVVVFRPLSSRRGASLRCAVSVGAA